MSPPVDDSNRMPRPVVASLSLTGRRILVVDPSQALPRALRGVQGASITIARMTMLTEELITRVAPDVVLAPLFSPDHDILDLARLLDRIGYQGLLRAYAPPLPNRAIVHAEVQQIWGDRDFEILEVPAHPH